jgi:uncharacterized membrane protein
MPVLEDEEIDNDVGDDRRARSYREEQQKKAQLQQQRQEEELRRQEELQMRQAQDRQRKQQAAKDLQRRVAIKALEGNEAGAVEELAKHPGTAAKVAGKKIVRQALLALLEWALPFLLIVLGIILVVVIVIVVAVYECNSTSWHGRLAQVSSTVVGFFGGPDFCAYFKDFKGVGTFIDQAQIPSPGGPGGGRCVPVTSGPATVANLSQTCFGANAQQASSIANVESGGNPLAHGDQCADGSYASWGLFQINISANSIAGLDCPSAFDKPANSASLIDPVANIYDCHVVNPALYSACVSAARDPATNIQAACQISSNGTNWRPWGANSICNF